MALSCEDRPSDASVGIPSFTSYRALCLASALPRSSVTSSPTLATSCDEEGPMATHTRTSSRTNAQFLADFYHTHLRPHGPLGHDYPNHDVDNTFNSGKRGTVILRTPAGVFVAAHRTLRWKRTYGTWRPERWIWVQTCATRTVAGMTLRQTTAQPLASHTRIWNTIPLEVLMNVIEYYVSNLRTLRRTIGVTSTSCERNGLANLALVCPAWLTHIAPLLHHTITVDALRVDELSALLRTPGSNIGRYARRLVVVGVQPWVASSRLARLLPGVNELHWGTDACTNDSPSFTHPSQLRTLCQIHAAFAGVKTLHLYHHTFLSVLDLLDLLGSFPALLSVYLVDVQIIAAPTTLSPKRQRSTQVQEIQCRQPRSRVMEPQPAALMSTFVHLFYEPPPSRHEPLCAFHGLPVFEVKLITSVLGCLKVPSISAKAHMCLYQDQTYDGQICA